MRSKLRYWWSQNYHPDSSGYTEKTGAVEALDPALYSAYNTFDACQVKFTAPYPNIQSLNQALAFINQRLGEKGTLSRQWGANISKPTTLEKFFIGSNAKHLLPVEEVQAFKAAAAAFLLRYSQLPYLDGSDAAYNARLLSSFHEQVLSVAKTLLQFSHR